MTLIVTQRLPGHRGHDQLVHDIAENCFTEVLRTNKRITSVIIWKTSDKLIKIRECIVTRASNGRISSAINKQYDKSGILIETLTNTINRSVIGKISTVEEVLT